MNHGSDEGNLDYGAQVTKFAIPTIKKSRRDQSKSQEGSKTRQTGNRRRKEKPELPPIVLCQSRSISMAHNSVIWSVEFPSWHTIPLFWVGKFLHGTQFRYFESENGTQFRYFESRTVSLEKRRGSSRNKKNKIKIKYHEKSLLKFLVKRRPAMLEHPVSNRFGWTSVLTREVDARIEEVADDSDSTTSKNHNDPFECWGTRLRWTGNQRSTRVKIRSRINHAGRSRSKNEPCPLISFGDHPQSLLTRRWCKNFQKFFTRVWILHSLENKKHHKR